MHWLMYAFGKKSNLKNLSLHSCYKTEKAMIVYSEIKTYAQFIPGSNK